jgi:hypothetical protein
MREAAVTGGDDKKVRRLPVTSTPDAKTLGEPVTAPTVPDGIAGKPKGEPVAAPLEVDDTPRRFRSDVQTDDKKRRGQP